MVGLGEKRARCGGVWTILFAICACSSAPEKKSLPNATVETGNAGTVAQAPPVMAAPIGSGGQPSAPPMNMPPMTTASGGTGGVTMPAAMDAGQMAAMDAGPPPYAPDLVFHMS